MIQRASSRPGAGDPGADEAGRRAQARARGRWIDHTAWRVSKVGSRPDGARANTDASYSPTGVHVLFQVFASFL